MKSLIFTGLSLIISIPYGVLGQSWFQNDSASYATQYISIEIGNLSPVPAWLKDSLAHETKDNTDFFDLIHSLNYDGVLTLSHWDASEKPKNTPPLVDELLAKSKDIHAYDDPEYDFPHYFYRFTVYNGEELFNDDGTPQLDRNGNVLLKQPDTLDLFFMRLSEVRLIEVTDCRHPQRTPEIKMIGFVGMDRDENSRELFWIDYKHLMDALLIMGLDPEQYYWYQILKQRKYDGFRYKEFPCKGPTQH